MFPKLIEFHIHKETKKTSFANYKEELLFWWHLSKNFFHNNYITTQFSPLKL